MKNILEKLLFLLGQCRDFRDHSDVVTKHSKSSKQKITTLFFFFFYATVPKVLRCLHKIIRHLSDKIEVRALS